MSALPVAALVLGGTSDLPSRVAFIFSAKAGPARATVAPSASVARMVLVFDMVLSLLASDDGASLTTTRLRFYSRGWLERLKVPTCLGLGHNGHETKTDSARIGECLDEFSLPPLWLAPPLLAFTGG